MGVAAGVVVGVAGRPAVSTVNGSRPAWPRLPQATAGRPCCLDRDDAVRAKRQRLRSEAPWR